MYCLLFWYAVTKYFIYVAHSKRRYRSRWYRGIYKYKRKRSTQNSISEDADGEDVIEGTENHHDSRLDETHCNKDVFLETQKQRLHNGYSHVKLTEEITDEPSDALISAGESLCKKKKLCTNETKWEENELGNGDCHKKQQLVTSEHREKKGDKPYHSPGLCIFIFGSTTIE